jgi:general stress protein 26
MTKPELFGFMSRQRLGVVSSTDSDGTAQSALVGIAVTPELEIIFDTLEHTRKVRNLFSRPDCSVVLGWDGEITVQYEGIARRYSVDDQGAWKDTYFATWPECRAHTSWPGLIYFVVSPKWIRYSDYGKSPPEILEFTF